jgi:ribonuclease HII
MLLNNPNNEEVFVGVDECGRGCLAGPVVAAAVVWNPLTTDHEIHEICDSKKITSKKKRDTLADFIRENAVDYSISFVNNETIDEMNILRASHKAMIDALTSLSVNYDHVLVDGNSFPGVTNKKHTCVVGGDNKYLCIAAASILAKTTRDSYMEELSKLFPEYKWDKNVGYGTKEHLEAIKQHGITQYHRLSFAPCAHDTLRACLYRNTL